MNRRAFICSRRTGCNCQSCCPARPPFPVNRYRRFRDSGWGVLGTDNTEEMPALAHSTGCAVIPRCRPCNRLWHALRRAVVLKASCRSEAHYAAYTSSLRGSRRCSFGTRFTFSAEAVSSLAGLLSNGGDSCSTGSICHPVLRSSLVKHSVWSILSKAACGTRQGLRHPWLRTAGPSLGRAPPCWNPPCRSLHVWTIKQNVQLKKGGTKHGKQQQTRT